MYAAGWIFAGTAAALAALLVLSTRAAQATPAEAGAFEALAAAADGESLGGDPRAPLTSPSDDLACRDLVRLVSDYLDGDLPSGWRASIDAHLAACDGCTAYLEQIRQTVALLEQIDANQHPAPAEASGAAEQPGTDHGAQHPMIPERPRQSWLSCSRSTTRACRSRAGWRRRCWRKARRWHGWTTPSG